MTRLEANLKILDYIEQYICNNPDVRFHQALFNLNINEFETKDDLGRIEVLPYLKDKYNQESSLTLSKLQL